MRTESLRGVDWEAVMPQTTSSVPSSNQTLQPQPQYHVMLPLVSQQSGIRKYKPKDWDAQRPEITKLYENDTLEGIIKFMRERHGLDAT